jgi:rhamnogalacturonan endolyase
MPFRLTRREMLRASLAAWPSLSAVTPSSSTSTSLPLPQSSSGTTELFRDDFSGFPAGWLSKPVGQLNTAIQEFHWIASRALPHGAWGNGVVDHDAWLVSSEDGKPYLQQQLFHPPHHVNEVLITGDPEWGDYTVEAAVKPLSLDGVAGLAFCYQTNVQYYAFGLTGGNTAQLALQHPIEVKIRYPNWEVMASKPFAYTVDRYYHLKVEDHGSHIRAYIDGNLLLEAEDAKVTRGKVGMTASIPARFQDFRVEVSETGREAIKARVQRRERELAALREENPKPRLWKKFETPGFGAGSNVRFGDLDGDGTLEMLIGQSIPTVIADAFDTISCLTAVNFDGKVLWQSGRPSPGNGLLTNDTPFQIHDIDGDGRNEVVAVRDFKLQILDGRTGKVMHWAWMPKAPPLENDPWASAPRPYERVLGDSIALVNVLGNRARHEILVKDRYHHFWIFNNKLELLWKGEGETGHFPYPIDDGGYDRILIGYAMWDHTGKQLWSHDRNYADHADSIVGGNFSGKPEKPPRVYSTGSDEGFLMFSYDGKILKQTLIGHAQCASFGKYRPDLPGLQYMTMTFHNNPAVTTLFNWEGNVLQQGELVHNCARIFPVNWRGDGQEFSLLSGDPHVGGMIDGHLRRVVMFPDDGHPSLCGYPLDVTGDARDEVIFWDEKSVWIYTQDRPFSGNKVYSPVRNPAYNVSNYSAIVSQPRWVASK